MTGHHPQRGFSLLEILVSVTIAAMLLVSLQQLLSTSVATLNAVDGRKDLASNARFAMARMVDAVRASDHLMIPMTDNPATDFDENVREQTVPASSPQGSSLLATAVLAIVLSPLQDLDSNGVADADNDGDGRIDEDLPADTQNDGKAGVRDFDDDGNGIKDFFLSPAGDDDESSDLGQSEDWINGVDDDGDGSIDEDPGADNNGDGCSGICGVDDDLDGAIDEDNPADDDEDGLSDEDWLDPVVFYLQGSALIERRAVPWDTSGDSAVSGRDYVESTLADNVTLLRFERVPPGAGQQLIDITLELTNGDNETISLNARVRLGALR